jgi:hypothetical protein
LSSSFKQVLSELAQSLEVHLHRRPVDPFGSEAVGDGAHLDVLLEHHLEDGEVVPTLLAPHDLLHRTKPDVVLVVDAVALQPAVEVLRSCRESMEVYNFIDELLVHANFQNVLKQDPQQVRQHVPALLLDGLDALFFLFLILKLLYN